jgi:CelD/BcsL family acetyltransferase involved in cellulose biosynthesis
MTLLTAPSNHPARAAAAKGSVLQVEGDVQRGLAIWRELEFRLAAPLPEVGPRPVPSYACSADWTANWLRHYGAIVPHKILTLTSDSGQVHGVCLVAQSKIRKGPFVLKQWHLGTAGEPGGHSVCVEYNRTLCDAAHHAEFRSLIAEWLLAHGRDGVALDGLAPEEWAGFAPHLPSAKALAVPSKYFDLTKARTAGTDVLSQLGRSTRQNLRRKLRDYGDVETTWAEDVETAHEIFDELVELHQARWQAIGKPGSFSSERFTAFQRDLLTQWIPQKRIVAFRVRHAGETVGCLVLLIDGRRVLDYFSGFISFEKKPSPGMVTHLLCMQEALARGYDAYDFLVGDKQHKDNLSTDETSILWAEQQPNTWKLRAFHAVRETKRAVVKWVEGRGSKVEGPSEQASGE